METTVTRVFRRNIYSRGIQLRDGGHFDHFNGGGPSETQENEAKLARANRPILG